MILSAMGIMLEIYITKAKEVRRTKTWLDSLTFKLQHQPVQHMNCLGRTINCVKASTLNMGNIQLMIHGEHVGN